MSTQPEEESIGLTGPPGPAGPIGPAGPAIELNLERFAEAPVVEVGRTLQLRQETVRGVLAIGFGIIFAAVVGLPLWFIDT
jgi:hypothetical protein